MQGDDSNVIVLLAASKCLINDFTIESVSEDDGNDSTLPVALKAFADILTKLDFLKGDPDVSVTPITLEKGIEDPILSVSVDPTVSTIVELRHDTNIEGVLDVLESVLGAAKEQVIFSADGSFL